MSTEKFPGLLNGALCNQKSAVGAGAVITCQYICMVQDQAGLTHDLPQHGRSVVISDQVDVIDGQFVERLLEGMLWVMFSRITFKVDP